jgi:Fe-S cluster assembly iron-binding protein IscA
MGSFDAGANLEQMRRRFAEAHSFLRRLFDWVPSNDQIPEVFWSRDRLMGFWSVQNHLWLKGRVVWSALIQANYQLFAPGTEILPGEVVSSFDPYFDANPDALIRTAENVSALKGTEPEDQQLRLVANRITDTLYRSLAERLPDALTESRDVRRFTVMIYQLHLPHAFVNGRLIPIIVSEGCCHAKILPHWYWSNELIDLWEPTVGQRLEFTEQAVIRARPMVQASPGALQAIRDMIAKKGVDPALTLIRLEIKNDGSISLFLDWQERPKDQWLTIKGLNFVVDPETAEQHWGSMIDYIDEPPNQGFTVRR